MRWLKGVAVALAAANEITRLSAVMPARSHYDHAMESPELAKRTGAMFLGSESTANIGRGWRMDLRVAPLHADP